MFNCSEGVSFETDQYNSASVFIFQQNLSLNQENYFHCKPTFFNK